MIDFENKSRYDFEDLKNLMRLLRGPEGCPWDREQTHESIRRNLLEEAYEAASAIDEQNSEELKEELGDILLQVLFHADIANDSGSFTLEDIIDVTCRKLLRRHPHVFSNVTVSSGDESLSVWEDVKRAEKSHDTIADSMDSVAHAIPALWRAEKIQKKAAKAGFDWPDYTGALDALQAEVTELENAAKAETPEAVKEEIGDILFSAVNLSRLLGIDPEDALNNSSDKFSARFRQMETLAQQRGISLTDRAGTKLSLQQLEELYIQAKSGK